MDALIQFIKSNYKLIAMGLFLILELILFLLKKRPKEKINIEELILKLLPYFIKEAEGYLGQGKGNEKFNFVYDNLKSYISEKYGLKVDTYKKFISDAIESILETPQKKGAK